MSDGELSGHKEDTARPRESLSADQRRSGELERQTCLRESEVADPAERERRRIAQRIHDGVAQNLALLLIKMEIISRLLDSDPAMAKAELAKARSVLEATVYELRAALGDWSSQDLLDG